MKNRAEFYAKIRFNVDFISDEIQKVETSEDIREMIVIVCNDISSGILGQIDICSDEDLVIKLMMELKRLDLIIRLISDNKEEQSACFLLMTHVGDMLHLIDEEEPELLDKYRRMKK